MSKETMQVYELARKHGEPVTEFVAKLNNLGFTVKSHLSRLTTEDLNTISALLTGTADKEPEPVKKKEVKKIPECCSAVITKVEERKFVVSIVSSTIVDGMLQVEVLEQSTCRSKSEALLESDRIGSRYRVNRV